MVSLNLNYCWSNVRVGHLDATTLSFGGHSIAQCSSVLCLACHNPACPVVHEPISAIYLVTCE